MTMGGTSAAAPTSRVAAAAAVASPLILKSGKKCEVVLKKKLVDQEVPWCGSRG